MIATLNWERKLVFFSRGCEQKYLSTSNLCSPNLKGQLLKTHKLSVYYLIYNHGWPDVLLPSRKNHFICIIWHANIKKICFDDRLLKSNSNGCIFRGTQNRWFFSTLSPFQNIINCLVLANMCNTSPWCHHCYSGISGILPGWQISW